MLVTSDAIRTDGEQQYEDQWLEKHDTTTSIDYEFWN